VVVDRPDLQGRRSILERHAKGVKMAGDVDFDSLARKTPGFVGADLANIVNEGALQAVKAGRTRVTEADLEEAIEKVMAGLRKKNRVMSAREKERVAHHETGHALVAAFTPGSDPVEKVSIIPRGLGALGYTMQSPAEDRYLMTEGDLLGRIDVLLGGRAAEEVVYGEISTGAAHDLGRATEIARQMVMDHGMTEKYRNTVLRSARQNPFGAPPAAEMPAPREIAESTQQYVDDRIAGILRERYERALGILRQRRALLAKVAARLLEKESLTDKEFRELVREEAEEMAPQPR
jgi:cell division protease FtsH